MDETPVSFETGVFYGVFQKGSWIYGKNAYRKSLEVKKELELSQKVV
jgi:hypothetical protein